MLELPVQVEHKYTENLCPCILPALNGECHIILQMLTQRAVNLASALSADNVTVRRVKSTEV